MILPTTQSITAKLSLEVKGTDQAAKLEGLKSSLKSAYKLVRQNIHKSYQSNKRYYGRTAKERTFSVGDVVYLFCPATKPGQCRKFQKKWADPFWIVARVSKLNYRIVNPQGEEFTVHVNRLKRANNQGIWQANQGRRPPRKNRIRRRATQEDEEAVCCPGPITVPVPRAENISRNSPRILDTPAASPPTPVNRGQSGRIQATFHQIHHARYANWGQPGRNPPHATTANAGIARGEVDFSAQGPVLYVPDIPAVATDHETGILQQLLFLNGTHLHQLTPWLPTTWRQSALSSTYMLPPRNT
jgi:hypothetical protein